MRSTELARSIICSQVQRPWKGEVEHDDSDASVLDRSLDGNSNHLELGIINRTIIVFCFSFEAKPFELKNKEKMINRIDKKYELGS